MEREKTQKRTMIALDLGAATLGEYSLINELCIAGELV
jgi:hypothetical protein